MKTIECVVNGVKVEAGQWWMTRAGKILYVVGINPFDDFPIWVHDIEDADVAVTYRHYGVSCEEPEDSLHRHLKFCTGFDWAGDGYRLLNVETDVAALGDELWNHYLSAWVHRDLFDGYKFGTSQGDFYRRKIATSEPAQLVTPTVTPSTPAVDPGEGYRLLSDDEPVLEGDEFWCNTRWELSSAHENPLGRCDTSPYRRKLPTRRPDTEYYLVPGSTRIAYIFRGTEDNAQFQTVLADGPWCVAFSELNPTWTKCTQQEAYDNRLRLMNPFNPRYFVSPLWCGTAYVVQREPKGLYFYVGLCGEERCSLPWDDADLPPQWKQVTQQEALSRVGAEPDDDDLEEDDDDFTDLGDVDDEDYDDDDRVQEHQNVTINITVNLFPAFSDEDDLEDDEDNACCGNACGGCGSSASLGSCRVMTASEPIKAGQFVVVADQPLSATNPGAGYRLIDKNVDTPKDGDQYWSDVENNWSDRIAGGRYTPSDTYRRKIEPTEPVCEAGYRWLKADEVIEATDQFQDCFDKQWKNPLFSMGSKAGSGNKWRRPIKPEPEPAPVQYRMLQAGEVIEKGDEYFISGEWDTSARVGLRVAKHQENQYRRKIDTTKDRYFVWSDGFSCYKLVNPDGTAHSVWRDRTVNETSINPLKPHTHDSEFLEVSKDFAEAAIRNR